MTDQTGPDLALAVAGVVGKKVVRGMDGVILSVENGYTRPWEWRPDLGGAAGAEVLEWCMAHLPMFRCGFSVEGPQASWFDANHWTTTQATYGPTIWIALCRAVIAWSER